MRLTVSRGLSTVLWGVLVTSASACGAGGGSARGDGGDGSPPLVTPADVTGLPAGDAQGQARSGAYVAQNPADPSSATQDCACRVGTCEELGQIDHWWIFSLAEDDGALVLSWLRGGQVTLPCAGGINAGGDFWCGKNDGSTLARIDGQVTTDGQVTELTMRSRELIRVANDGLGHALDCDSRQTATFILAN